MADKPAKKAGFMESVRAFFGKIAKFFRDTIGEMKKVVWPSKKQIKNNTIIVLVVVLVAAVILFGLDTIFGLLLKLAIGA